jgi:hypothetical protein
MRLAYVADRESDFIDLMAQASALGTPVHWLIRSAHNRKMAGQQEKLWDGFTETHGLGEVRFYLLARKGQKARDVVQQVSAKRCTLQAPNGQAIELTAALAQEAGAPDGAKPIQWRLLTNRGATTLEESAKLIDWCRCRSEIESLFQRLESVLHSEGTSLGHPRAALLAFGVAVLSYNILAVLQSAVWSAHELHTSDIELSSYFFAREIPHYAGMRMAVAPAAWERYDRLTPVQLAQVL